MKKTNNNPNHSIWDVPQTETTSKPSIFEEKIMTLLTAIVCGVIAFFLILVGAAHQGILSFIIFVPPALFFSCLCGTLIELFFNYEE